MGDYFIPEFKNIQEGDTSDSTERVRVVEGINYSQVTCS